MHAVRGTHPNDIDAELTSLSQKQGALDHEIGRCLLLALSARVHEHLGLSSFVEYANLRLGYSPRFTKEKLRVARALERLPKLERALATGAQTWSAARELTRVATPNTEAEWLDAAQGKTQRELERLVAGHRPGARPTDAKDPLLTPRRVVLDLPPEVYALLMDAYAQLREVHGPAATHVELTRVMAEIVLGAAKAEGRPAYHIAVAVCAECQRTLQSAGAQRVGVSPAIGACATCDGEVVGLTDFEDPVVAAAAPESASEPAPGQTHGGRPKSPVDCRRAPSVFSAVADPPRPETHGGPTRSPTGERLATPLAVPRHRLPARLLHPLRPQHPAQPQAPLLPPRLLRIPHHPGPGASRLALSPMRRTHRSLPGTPTLRDLRGIVLRPGQDPPVVHRSDRLNTSR